MEYRLMARWQDMTQQEVFTFFLDFGQNIRKGSLTLGRHHYALGLAQAVRQAIHCGFPRVTAIELGVFTGAGLLELCSAAQYFMDKLGIEIAVYGFDSAHGLPPL